MVGLFVIFLYKVQGMSLRSVILSRVEGPNAKKHKELNILLVNKMHEGH